jgi:hypothetical protein
VRRADLGLIAAAIVMTVVATMRASTLWHGSYIPEAEAISAARPLSPPSGVSAPAKPWVRPLFSRPGSGLAAEPPNANTMSGTAPGSQLPRLIGVIINQNDRVAILGYAGKVQHLQENGRIGSWTLSRIDRRSAMLQSATESHLLKLDSEAR